MNKQKWLAGLTAVLCSAGALSCFPAISGTVSAAELVSNDFEVNYGGWYGSADAVALTAEDGIRDYYASRGLGDVYKRQVQIWTRHRKRKPN